MRALWGTVVGCLLAAGCASAPPPEPVEACRPPRILNRLAPGGAVQRVVPRRMLCGRPAEVQLRDLLDRVAAQLGISIAAHPDLAISVPVDGLPRARDWRPWLRELLARHPFRLVRIGAVWLVEPTAELGPTLKELSRPEGAR